MFGCNLSASNRRKSNETLLSGTSGSWSKGGILSLSLIILTIRDALDSIGASDSMSEDKPIKDGE